MERVRPRFKDHSRFPAASGRELFSGKSDHHWLFRPAQRGHPVGADCSGAFYGPISCFDGEGGQKHPWRIFVWRKGRAEEGQHSSGGEKARLVLAELLQSRPNFLILDEPTNHMDIRAKETLESAFCAYKGTILFVSHDRYFIRQVADAVMIFEHQSVVYYPFGYEHYLERKARENQNGSMAAQIKVEEQALIAGMRAVPKAERHRLREIPEDEAYREWNMRLAAERLEPAGNAVEYLTGQVRELKAMWQGSEAYWNGGVWDRMDEYENQCLRLKQAWEEWHRACMEWLDKAQEMEVL